MGSCKSNDSDSILIQSLFPLNLSKTLPTSQQSQQPTTTRGSSENKTRTRTRLDEEAQIEREIINAITTGRTESLNPNSGQAIQIGDHYVCVSFHEEAEAEAESSCRVWEWHGHVVCYSEASGYTQEYVYGSYFERTMSLAMFEESDQEVDQERCLGSTPLFGGLNLVNLRNNIGRI